MLLRLTIYFFHNEDQAFICRMVTYLFCINAIKNSMQTRSDPRIFKSSV